MTSHQAEGEVVLVQFGNEPVPATVALPDLQEFGEVSSVLAMPFYPVAYGIACAFVLTSIVMLAAPLAPRTPAA